MDNLSELRRPRVVEQPTTYMETLTHFLRANIGTGLFAMGDAIKNSGLIAGPIFTAFMGFICVYSEHLLLNASTTLKDILELEQAPDFATTVELCFQLGPERMHKYSLCMRRIINIFLCVTQLGFCCIHIVFVTTSINQVLDQYGYVYDFHLLMVGTIIPILVFVMIRNLKRLAPLSALANVLIFCGTLMTMYYVVKGFVVHKDVVYVSKLEQIPLFFGTIIYCFEGIGVVIPLKTEMIYPEKFDSPFGVLNVGKAFVTISYIIIGVLAYLRYGDEVKGSITLNIPPKDKLAQAVKLVTGVAILCTYPIQFYVAFQILWFPTLERFGPFKHPLLWEILFRLSLALLTFTLAEVIPYLNLFISLVGAFSSAVLALWIPPMLEYLIAWKMSTVTAWIIAKDLFIFSIGVVGALTGSYESILAIIEEIPKTPNVTVPHRHYRLGTSWFNV